MNSFHIILTFLTIIVDRFKDAGLRDVVIQSRILAEGSIDIRSTGTRIYKRSIWVHKILHYTLSRILWNEFERDYPNHQRQCKMFGNMQISTLLQLRSFGITVMIKKIFCLANSSLVFLKCPISCLVFCLQQEMVNDNFFKRLSKILFHGFLSMFASATVLFCIIYFEDLGS